MALYQNYLQSTNCKMFNLCLLETCELEILFVILCYVTFPVLTMAGATILPFLATVVVFDCTLTPRIEIKIKYFFKTISLSSVSESI